MHPQGKGRAVGQRVAWALLTVLAFAVVLGWASGGIGFGSTGSAGTLSAQATSGDIATGAGIFTEATIAITVSVLFVGAFSLQIARNYFLRTLDKFTLRLGADIWWLAYVMIRDGLMFGALLLGFEVFFVGTYGDYAIAVPWMPLAIVLTALVLLIKLVKDTDEDEKWNRLVSTLIAGASFFYIFGVLMVTESIAGYGTAGYIWNADGTISTPAGGSDMWTFAYNTFSSTVNVPLATLTFYVCFTALSALAAFAFIYVTKPSLLQRFKRTPEKATAATPATRDQAVQAVADKAH